MPKTFSTWLPAPVAKAFACALARLSAAGAVIVERDMIEFAESLDIRALGMGICRASPCVSALNTLIDAEIAIRRVEAFAPSPEQVAWNAGTRRNVSGS
ncbi:hypothetical protein ACU4HD_28385 [Cupriavidus basilensis]